MAYVVTRLCRDCKDYSCVPSCPTDAFLEPKASAADLPNQLFIDPDDCIDCDACVTACAYEAIFADVNVPDAFEPDVKLNELVRERRQDFQPPQVVEKELPTVEQIEAN